MARRSSGIKLITASLCVLSKVCFLLVKVSFAGVSFLFYLSYSLFLFLSGLTQRMTFSLHSPFRWYQQLCQNRRLQMLTMEGLDQMTGVQFEQYLIGLWRHNGYSVEHIGKAGDQGCDLLLKRDGVRMVCQAKCYTGVVTNGAVQEAVAAKAYYGAEESIVITNSYFTKSARALAFANGCRLIDRDKLGALISQYRKSDNPTFLERTYERFFMH